MVIVVFGVSGAGKSLIGSLLAAELGWKFYDADLFHSAGNLDKLRRGVPLSDEDRAPWLKRLCAQLREVEGRGESAVLAFSGLKRAYRQRLAGCAAVRLVYLKGDPDLIDRRLRGRPGHFMNPDLLPSQFETLEEPRGEALVLDVRLAPAQIVRQIRAGLGV